ncbi:MAG: hypothetical protein GQ538_08610 [Xanthomonadales bacterium]|nr:hypothetical protein [Xanthomonadales bacterium]
MKKFLATARLPRRSNGKIQPLLLFLMGIGFVALGLRSYPAFIGVGGLFLIIGYRGYTCRARKIPDPD